MGYIDNVFLGVRPWTRAGLAHMIVDAGATIEDGEEDGDSTAMEAGSIYRSLLREVGTGSDDGCAHQPPEAKLESVYSIARGMGGTPLRDSFHLGSTIVNDYGRPYASGFNNYSGISGYAIAGRFAFYVRTEFQGSPSATGYSPALAQELSTIDQTTYLNPATGLPYNQDTIPAGQLASSVYGRLLEAYLSFQYQNHEFSFGKLDEWLGPAQGGSFAYSNNAQNIYAFHINRIEPLHVPALSRITGPFRYEFLVGALRGHTLMPNPAYPGADQPNIITPGDPWVHVEKISFRPTENLEFGFERTALFGGEGHAPVTMKSFLRSFFSTYSPSVSVKFGPDDPGARFGSFDFSYRLPFLRNWLTLYSDAEAHDDVSPIDAPRHACVRPGLYLSHVPGVAKLDFRVEAVSTAPPTPNSHGGVFEYWEGLEKQGYTNQGAIFGDWIGREAKGGQGWISYHLSGNEWIQLELRNQKAADDFIPGGTTINDIDAQVVKRFRKDLELRCNFGLERWKAPIYLAGQQTSTTTEIQLTWFAGRKVAF